MCQQCIYEEFCALEFSHRYPIRTVERVFKKVNIVNAKGEKRALKYKIPPEAIEDIREALKPYFN